MHYTGPHGEARLRGQPADLEEDADAAEADEECCKQKSSVLWQGKDAAGQLQQTRADGAHRLRKEREEPPAEKSRRNACERHPCAEIEDGADALLDRFGEGDGSGNGADRPG